jgi:hypothetical protein
MSASISSRLIKAFITSVYRIDSRAHLQKASRYSSFEAFKSSTALPPAAPFALSSTPADPIRELDAGSAAPEPRDQSPALAKYHNNRQGKDDRIEVWETHIAGHLFVSLYVVSLLGIFRPRRFFIVRFLTSLRT